MFQASFVRLIVYLYRWMFWNLESVFSHQLIYWCLVWSDSTADRTAGLLRWGLSSPWTGREREAWNRPADWLTDSTPTSFLPCSLSCFIFTKDASCSCQSVCFETSFSLWKYGDQNIWIKSCLTCLESCRTWALVPPIPVRLYFFFPESNKDATMGTPITYCFGTGYATSMQSVFA